MAIIGLAGRYPQSKNLDEFWINLVKNKNCIRELQNERYDYQAYYGNPKTETGKTNIRHFGLLDDIYCFDAPFFNISNRESEVMDPHMRLLLETVWSCVENAGYNPKSLAGTKTGVFVSFYNYEYGDLVKELEIEKSSEPYLGTGMGGTIMANRISFILGLTGPSEVYNTACSTALVALHRAIQSISAGDCHQALVSGVSLLLTAARVIGLSKMGILNESPICNSFSYPANKEIIGEGVGAVMVKPLTKALEANDYIYAVVRGTDVNHPGNHSGRLTLPSAKPLAELMLNTYKKLNIKANELCYIEGHGSGNDTDVAELIAFQEALAKRSPNGKKVAVGSVKSNIGFGEGSGGIAQLTKCALAFHHRLIPATLHFEKADPIFDLNNSLIKIQTSNTPLDCDHERKYMSMIAYGLGGTNAHAVVSNHIFEQECQIREEGIDTFPMIFSAKAQEILIAYVQDVYNHLNLASNQTRYRSLCPKDRLLLKALSLTLIGRERHLNCRIAFVVDSYTSLLASCKDFLADNENECTILADDPSAANKTDEFLESCLEKKNAKDLAKLWVQGLEIPWLRLYNDPSYQKIPLPSVPFMGKIHQLEIRKEKESSLTSNQPSLSDIEKRMVVTQEEELTRIELTVYHDDYFINQHVVDGVPIMPAVGYLALLTGIAQRIFKLDTFTIKNVAWVMPFNLSNESSTILFEFTASGNFRILQTEQQKLCCKGQLQLNTLPKMDDFSSQTSSSVLEGVKPFIQKDTYWNLTRSFDSKQSYGPDFRRLSEIYRVDQMILGVLEPNSSSLPLPEIPFYDSSLGVCNGFAIEKASEPSPAVPFSMDQFHFLRPIDTQQNVYVTARERTGKLPRYDISIEDGNGIIYALFYGYFCKPFQKLPDANSSLVAKKTNEKPSEAIKAKNHRPEPVIQNGPHTNGTPSNTESDNIGTGNIKEIFTAEFQKKIADFLKVEVEEVPLDESLEPLGLDSIAVNELTDQMSNGIKIDIPPTTMFEYTHIEDIVDFLLDEFEEEIYAYMQLKPSSGNPSESARGASTVSPTVNIDIHGGGNGTTWAGSKPHPENEGISHFTSSTPNSHSSNSPDEDTGIAIVGIGGLFPGAKNVHEFWDKIKAGHDFITEVPEPRRTSIYSVYEQQIEDLKGLYAGFIEDADKFDAAFFNFSEEEVIAMDPQQRLFLEATWHAIEDAGYYPLSLSGRKIGVYVGAVWE